MKNRNVALTVAFVCILFGGALMAIAHSAVHANEDKAFTEYQVVANFKNIEIKNTSWNVKIQPGNVSTTKIEINGDESFMPSFYTLDDTFYLDLTYSEEWWKVTPFLLGAEVTITLPAKNYADVHIVSTSGKVEVENMNLSNLTISSTSGRVELEDINVSDKFKAVTTSGSVNFEDFDAGSLDIRTTSGHVAGSLESGKVFEVKTASGNINVPASTTGGKCYINTTSGSVKITVD